MWYQGLGKHFWKRTVMLIIGVSMLAWAPLSAAQDMPTPGGTLRVAVPAITSLDPIFIADDVSMYPSSLVYQFLVRAIRTEDGSIEYIGDLAESWETSEDNTVITFTLREGHTFHDGNAVFPEGQGREVVADDVVYSMERLLNTPGSVVPSDIVSTFVSIEALDPRTVRLTLSSPNGLLFDGARGLSFMAIYPREAVEQLGDALRTNPIGSGPFEFVEYVVDERVLLRRNEDYPIAPLLDAVEFRIIPQASSQVLAVEAGEIDVITSPVPSVDIPRLQDNPNVRLIDTRITGATQILFNLAVEKFQDIRMREAIAKAIDGRGIMRAVNGADLWVDGCGTTGPGWPGFAPDLCRHFPYDPDTSRALLAELGYVDTNGDGIVELNGEPLVINITAWNLPEMPRQMEAVVQQLSEVGIDARLQVVEFATWIDDYFAGRGELMPLSGFCCIGGTEAFWGTGGFSEAMSIKDEEAQALLAQALTVLDPVERSPLIIEGAERIYSQYYSIPMGFLTGFTLVSARVQDFPGYFWWFHLVGEDFNTWLSR